MARWARLSVGPDGEVVFRLTDQSGGAGTDGSGLVLINDTTEPGIQMLATAKATRLTLKDKTGAERTISP